MESSEAQGRMHVIIDRWTLAEELWSFGEDDLHRVPLNMTDEELIRLWQIAGKTYLDGSARSSGEAAALALVSLVEGRTRPLARTRRRPQSQRTTFPETPEDRHADVFRIQQRHDFPHPWHDSR